MFSRSKGHSAVAAAAYRSGTKLKDERTGKIHRYDKRSGVAETFILLPSNTSHLFVPDAQMGVPDADQQKDHLSELPDRAFLWNAVEASETRKNSCVARELILALPHELSYKERSDLTRDMALYLMERYRVAVDSAIHAPVEGDGHDSRNYHAHILFSTRELTSTGFGKKTRILDDKVTGKEETELIRKVWETLSNDALSRAGHGDVQIDHRSLEEQGIDRIPQIHVGPHAWHGEGQAQPKFTSEEIEHRSSDEDDETDDEGTKDGSQEGGDQSSSGSGGGAVLAIDTLAKDHLVLTEENQQHSKSFDIDKLIGGRTYQYGVNEPLNRKEFNALIKRVNNERAAFSEVPLKEQVKEIDYLLEKLDHRLKRLEDIKERSSLSTQLKRSFSQFISSAIETLSSGSSSTLTSFLEKRAEERRHQKRRERQQARYSSAYRTGIHARIQDMKGQIEALQSKSSEAKRYEIFIDTLQRDINAHITHRSTQKTKAPIGTQENNLTHHHKRLSNKESSLKLSLKAELIREALKAPERSSKNVLQANDYNNETVNPETNLSLKSSNLSAQLYSFDRASLKVNIEVLGARFNEHSSEKPSELVNKKASYKQRITPLKLEDQKGAQVLDEKPLTKENAQDRYFIKAHSRIKPFTDIIAKKGQEIRRLDPIKGQVLSVEPETRIGHFNLRADQLHRFNDKVLLKVREEAAVKRANIPSQYRAEAYPKDEAEIQLKDALSRKLAKQKSSKSEQKTMRSSWEIGMGLELESAEEYNPVKYLKVKMSNSFNATSFNEITSPEVSESPVHTDAPSIDLIE